MGFIAVKGRAYNADVNMEFVAAPKINGLIAKDDVTHIVALGAGLGI